MESESGVETEWGSGRLTGQELLLDLRRKLDKMKIEAEEAFGMESDTVLLLDLRKKYIKHRYLSMESDSGKVTEVDSDSGRNEIIGMLRETKELEEWMMRIKEEKEKQSLMEGKIEVKEAEVKEESESGMETEGQELLLDLGRKLDKMEIDLGEWTEEQETVRILKMKHMKLNQRRRDLSMGSGSGKVTEVDSDPSHNKVIGMLREVKQLEFMIIKAKKKQLRKKQETAGDSSEEMDRDSGEHQSQSQSLMEEIISVERERKDLFGSLTPTFSRWKEIDSQATWTIARKEPDDSSSTVDNDENQLADYFSLMLQDMEDLGHRMLSMLYFLNKSNDPICSYKATELCNATARLNRHISKEFVTDQEPEPEEEPGQINLLSLFRKYYRFPNNYDNTLAQLDMEEDEEENKCEDVKVKKTKEEEEKEKEKEDVSTMEYLKKRMDIDQQFLAKDRKFWENVWGSRIGRCGGFMDTTILSPMQFTHNTPGRIPSPAAIAGSTLQIYSIKIKNLKGLKWPLRVHGEVAARDTVDRNRNILFSRSRFDYQELTGEDDCLCLTGPSRAIVALDHVEFEVDLQVTEGAESKTLMSCRGCYGGTDDFFSSLGSVTDGGDGCTFSLSNDSCRAEVALEQLDRSLQATIVGVRVTEGRWPFKYGCRVVCSWSAASDTTCRRVVLFDHRGRGLRRRSNGYLDLSRRVVSVESHGTLRVGIEAYGKSRRYVAREGHINFSVQQCQTKRLGCRVGDATVEVAVAWSLLVKEKACLSLG